MADGLSLVNNVLTSNYRDHQLIIGINGCDTELPLRSYQTAPSCFKNYNEFLYKSQKVHSIFTA